MKEKLYSIISVLSAEGSFNTSRIAPHNVIRNLFRQLNSTIDTFAQQEILKLSNPKIYLPSIQNPQHANSIQFRFLCVRLAFTLALFGVTDVEYLVASAWLNPMYCEWQQKKPH